MDVVIANERTPEVVVVNEYVCVIHCDATAVLNRFPMTDPLYDTVHVVGRLEHINETVSCALKPFWDVIVADVNV